MSGLVKEKNLLARSAYHYEIQDVKEPNLFREFFPYSEVPKIPFNHRIVPQYTPEEFWISDTTFRDGQQSRPPYSVKQIVDIYDMFLKLGMTRREAANKYLDIVSKALESGIIPRCHLEDITRADFYGFVIPFVQKLMLLSEQSGIPVKIRACDTMGYGVPYIGASTPRGNPELIYGLVHYGGVP